MAANRIRVAKDKAELVKQLLASKDTTGPFQTYVEVMVFAAALGVKNKKRVPLGEFTKREPSPIPQENFASLGHDLIIKLLGITETKDIQILSSREEEYEDQRTQIFEEYANGGLEILQNELRGAVDYSERLLLVLISEKDAQEQSDEEFDLSKFLI
ncbi:MULTISPECIES: DNA phosphorothioation-associated protein 4 [Cyanophyceae]|uniref:DNA phosphorothioation-associated protein 4 n=1 Tax=Cyanophyceae TaxID=3028117 RepID=UPI00232CCA0A|nr:MULTISPECIES: DNA phosphorothioation-associated protein 4 [Cyanophyceae]MDB9358531.1 DNA phosphorothioation-associated protein 4 [Nodularia spumigena CS-587/03]MDB9317080.1 DNA phosphorothioation-associated protein 4 [Nodularia spumigena CS-590/01A]MDB9323180.1 DNA phosphorothioation-associated protein 4 [Nodularia spumigena CS-591/07A]MDB9328151.1 DNA phosphorothioation-associated protein 4 [Nodularia spumigena CS-590/02]MDB9331421.1 DNA phosphorothioation-associated protein 4 [Nodularia s